MNHEMAEIIPDDTDRCVYVQQVDEKGSIYLSIQLKGGWANCILSPEKADQLVAEIQKRRGTA